MHMYRREVTQIKASTCWASDSGARGRSLAGNPRPACLEHAASMRLRKPAHWQLGLGSMHQTLAEPEAQAQFSLPQECLTSCYWHSGAQPDKGANTHFCCQITAAKTVSDKSRTIMTHANLQSSRPGLTNLTPACYTPASGSQPVPDVAAHLRGCRMAGKAPAAG